jgi:hypothetical protein
MSAGSRTLWALAWAVSAGSASGQSFHYVEPGVASCAAPPAASASAPKKVAQGAAVSGRLHVSCGFDKGSYTVVLSSTDADAAITPKTFLVNFGRLSGNGAFSVKFATPGVQSVSAAITSNMGSPAVTGRFVSSGNEFEVGAR